MSLTYPETGMHRLLNHYMPEQYVFDIDPQQQDRSGAVLEESLAEIGEMVAGLVIELLV